MDEWRVKNPPIQWPAFYTRADGWSVKRKKMTNWSEGLGGEWQSDFLALATLAFTL
jgi:hypothetical protein